jgi:hypothetical protein
MTTDRCPCGAIERERAFVVFPYKIRVPGTSVRRPCMQKNEKCMYGRCGELW